MFVLRDQYAFDWPVTVKVPSQVKPGSFEEQRFTATFLALPIEDSRAMLEEARAAVGIEGIDQVRTLIERVLVGFKDVRDASGAEVPYSADARTALIRWAFTRLALARAYEEAMSGAAIEERRLGN